MDQLAHADTCPTCGSTRAGRFCSNCGEKKLSPDDFTFKKYVQQGIDVFTHFEGKFFRSFKYLLFYPGKLTTEYLSGRRVKLMKPLQLYLIVGIAFFFLFKNWDIFFGRLQYEVIGSFDPETGYTIGYKPGELKGRELALLHFAEAKASSKSLSLQDFVIGVDQHQPALAKLLAFLLIPMLSVFIYMTSFKKEGRYVPHLIHATHLFTFLLAIMTIWVGGYNLLAKWFHWKLNYSVAFIPPNLIFIIYSFFSFNRVLPFKRWILQVARAIVFAGGLIVVIPLYRELILWLSVALA